MKKILSVVLSLLLIVTLSACGNVSIGPGNFKFETVHIDTYNYTGCLTIEKWYEDETGIEVKTKEVGAIYLSEGTYFLIEKECPFCAHQTEKGGESE